MNYNRFTLGICELFHPYIHGVNDDSDTTICEKLIVHSTFKAKKFYDFKHEQLINCVNNSYEYLYNINRLYRQESHPTIRNYYNIVNKSNYIKVNIIEIETLPTQEVVCIIKTFWIKIIQRKWKKVYKERNLLLQKMKNPLNLMKRECSGKFHIKIRNYPEFKLTLMN